MHYERTLFMLLALCAACLLGLAACGQAPSYWQKNPVSKAQEEGPPPAPYAENLTTKKLPTPSLIWREGKQKIIQYAGRADGRGAPNCTLLIFLDEQDEIDNFISQPLTERAPKDGEACLRAWQRY